MFLWTLSLLLPGLTIRGQDRKGTSELQEQVRSAHTITYCDLLENEKRYNGAIVRVRAIYLVEFEASTISSPECDVRSLSTWVEFNPAFEQLTQREWRSKIRNVKWDRGVDVVFVGNFELGRFGHLAGYSSQLTVLSAERVEPLGKFKPLPEGTQSSSGSAATIPKRITFCEAASKGIEEDVVRVAATLSVIKDESSLYDESCRDHQSVFAEFAPNWRATTSKSVTNTIEKLHESSRAWLKSPGSSVHLALRTADVVLEGFIIPNPHLRKTEDVSQLTGRTDSRAAYSLLFVVQRVISVKERKNTSR